jgi:hypothetical protein
LLKSWSEQSLLVTQIVEKSISQPLKISIIGRDKTDFCEIKDGVLVSSITEMVEREGVNGNIYDPKINIEKILTEKGKFSKDRKSPLKPIFVDLDE